MLKRLQEKAGYVSIETVIVASFMIVLGLYGLVELSGAATLLMDTAVTQLNEAVTVVGGKRGAGA